MKLGQDILKTAFGLIIFMFSLALAYFTADYVDQQTLFDYWTTLFLFAAVFIAVGVALFHVLPISLGFLFAADVLLLHLFIENFGTMPDISKTLIIGGALVLLYVFAWAKMKDVPQNVSYTNPPPTTPPTPSV